MFVISWTKSLEWHVIRDSPNQKREHFSSYLAVLFTYLNCLFWYPLWIFRATNHRDSCLLCNITGQDSASPVVLEESIKCIWKAAILTWWLGIVARSRELSVSSAHKTARNVVWRKWSNWVVISEKRHRRWVFWGTTSVRFYFRLHVRQRCQSLQNCTSQSRHAAR